MNTLGIDPENNTRILLAEILSNLGSPDIDDLIKLFQQYQRRCYDDGIVGMFVPYGENNLAVVITGPEDAQIIMVNRGMGISIRGLVEENEEPDIPM